MQKFQENLKDNIKSQKPSILLPSSEEEDFRTEFSISDNVRKKFPKYDCTKLKPEQKALFLSCYIKPLIPDCQNSTFLLEHIYNLP